MKLRPTRTSRLAIKFACVAGLLLIMATELALSARRQSQTWDEAYHMLAGYRYWQAGDYGINPEHPPLVKLLAAIPLVVAGPRVPAVPQGTSKFEGFVDGRKFLYLNDADVLLFRSRMMAALLSVLLALLVFNAAEEFFGTAPALLALALLVFEPNLLAHGASVTTDVGVSCFLFASVYTFYRYLKERSTLRLIECGCVAGLTLAAKHSGVLVLPTLVLLALGELFLIRTRTEVLAGAAPPVRASVKRTALRLTAALAAITAVAIIVLWSFYGFRFQARPGNLEMTPSLAQYMRGSGALPALKNPVFFFIISESARFRLLPESYLYGLTDVLIGSASPRPSYIFSRLHPHGLWFYFPMVVLIKSTLGMLILLALGLATQALRRDQFRRETLFVALPPAFYLGMSMTSGMNMGVRHILPIYPFLLTLAAAGAWALANNHRAWRFAIAALVAFHIFSSLRTYPFYMAYSNEAWGGPAKTYRVLSDSNVDWGQGLKTVKQYLDQHDIHDCWFAYFGSADPSYNRIPCKLLPDPFIAWWGQPVNVAPAEYKGTVLLSASELASPFFGPDELNPYTGFQTRTPVENLGGSVLVYQGQFDLSLASDWSRLQQAWELSAKHQLEPAVAEARAVVADAPRLVYAHYTLGSLLIQAKQKDEARREYQAAIALAREVHPEYQWFWVPYLTAQLKSM